MDILRWDAFVVIRVIAEQHLTVEAFFGRVIFHGNKIRQNLLADFFGKRLALIDVLLTESFEAMAQNFVKENCGGAAGQQCGPCIGIN